MPSMHTPAHHLHPNIEFHSCKPWPNLIFNMYQYEKTSNFLLSAFPIVLIYMLYIPKDYMHNTCYHNYC